ncbi:MAG: hypothetical protein FWE56_04820 [Candidatus Bathyarchaeota archaeon]|nr:hypothetical protein [Candidatus Termiticorpusculum sp.]MCL2868790.1 hypothetical protein [Candidatus Termiticorpusculum sp.]
MNNVDQPCYIIPSFINTHRSEKKLCSTCLFNATRDKNTECFNCEQDIFGIKVMAQYKEKTPKFKDGYFFIDACCCNTETTKQTPQKDTSILSKIWSCSTCNSNPDVCDECVMPTRNPLGKRPSEWTSKHPKREVI